MSSNYQDITNKILDELKINQDLYDSDYLIQFENDVAKMKTEVERAKDDGRKLKIGIVGEVKAGKSSFLNALIFKGEDILPKACTPMTAALTKITYSLEPMVQIHFYEEYDWEIVKERSEQYDKNFEKFCIEWEKNKKTNSKESTFCKKKDIQHTDRKRLEEIFKRTKSKEYSAYISCKELTNMVKQSGVNIEDYLGKTVKLDKNVLQAGMKNSLLEYIGANGKYTPIVKWVELGIDSNSLKNIEIIDTPGLNDPILSRSEKTKDFLSECDVVFLLSYAGQFLDKEDIKFITETLPDEGIKEAVIVGSKFDSGMLDDNESTSYVVSYHKLKEKYNQHAEKILSSCINDREDNNNLIKIKESLPPCYVSSIMYVCSEKRKNNISYSDDELHVINNFKRHFKDFEDDEKTLKAISGINNIKKNKIKIIMDNKGNIIKEKNRNTLNNYQEKLNKILNKILDNSILNKKQIETETKEDLENKLTEIEAILDRIQGEVKNIFYQNIYTSKKVFANIKISIDKETNNYEELQVKINQEEEVEKYKDGWFGLRKNSRVITKTIKTVSVSDSLRNIKNYITRCKELANSEFEKVVNIQKFQDEIKEVVLPLFDLSDKRFNEREILDPLEVVVNQITIPKIEIETVNYQQMIEKEFSSSYAEGNEIHELQKLQQKVLTLVSKEIQNEIDKCEQKLINTMEQEAGEFVQKVQKKFQDNLLKLKEQINDKENSKKRYINLEKNIEQFKNMVLNMEV